MKTNGGKSDVILEHPTRPQLEARVGQLAERLGMDKPTAVHQWKEGSLPSTNTATELKLVLHLLTK